MATVRSRWLVAVMLAGVVGCGASARDPATSTESRTAPAAADPTAVAVIRAWSTALRQGDLNTAARYFALPSEFVNGPTDVISIHTEAQARLANASLPCGAVLVSAARRGRFVSALFRLTDRVGASGACGTGTGQLARTNFVIADGHIVEWIRAPDPGGGGAPSPAAPRTQGSGPVV
jgi:limonene-1,2-epoxide hydrolase